MLLKRAPFFVAVAIAAALALGATPAPSRRFTFKEVAALPVPAPDQRIAYGADSLQFGELRLPHGKGPFPVAIVIHGGCWRSEYDLAHIGPLAAALTARGIATWTIEYRRIGNPGGGWPGTFQDVGRAADFVRVLAKDHPLDVRRVVAIGHSAGGHLALWLAARRGLPASSAVAAPDPLPLRGVVGLAAIGDLAEYGRGTSWCSQSVPLLMGGGPDSLAAAYAEASPIERLPLGVPVRLIHGADDEIVPIAQSRTFVARARERGDDARLVEPAGAGHFDLIAPEAAAFAEVERAVRELAGAR